MAVITKSFRDFFTESYNEQRVYDRHFQTFYEMAMWKDIPKTPVNIDKEDIAFLHQFPHKYWPKALHMRYQMLFDAIEKRHKAQAETSQKLEGAIKKAMLTQNWGLLQGIMPADEIAKLQQYFTREKVAKIRGGYEQSRGKSGADPIDEIAAKEAWQHLKDLNDHIEDPEGEVPFAIKTPDFDPETGKQIGSGKSAPGSRGYPTFMAKPYLNRLYHKLERTHGLPHIAGSGLEGEQGKELGHETAKYGYHLHDPQRSPHVFRVAMNDGQEILVHAYDEKDVPQAVEAKGGKAEDIKDIKRTSTLPHVTAGMKFPTEENIEKRVLDYMNLTAHRMFGELPDDAKWMKTGYKDSWAINYVKDQLQKHFEGQLRLQGGFETASERRKAAAKMVSENLIALAKQGKLKGPPIPGVAPEGLPITVKEGKGGETLVPPDLYLPYHAKEVKTRNAEGQVTTQTRMVPIVNPANFYRELGSEEEDYATDHEGQKVFDPDSGKPVFKVPPERLVGHEKQFVRVDTDEYRHGHGAKGAFQFNHDTHGREYLSPGDPEYDDAWDEVFGERGMEKGNLEGTRFVPNSNGAYYKDIINGILNCARGSQCGDATPRERANILANVDALHSVVSYLMSQSLRSQHFHGNDKEAQANRRAFANDITAGYAQKDLGLGGGTRRMRKLSAIAGHQSMDATTGGKDGGTIGVTHDLNVADKRKIGLDGEDDGGAGAVGPRGKGERQLDTSHQTTPGEHSPYNLANLSQIVKGLMADATAVDAETKKAIELGKVQQGQAVLDLLNRGIKDHGEIMDAIVGLLAAMYRQQGLKRVRTASGWKDEALEEAQSTVEGWVKEGHRGQDLVQQFTQHPMVQEAMKSVPQDQVQRQKREVPLSDEDVELQKGASAWLHRKLEKIQGNPTLLQQELAKDDSGLSKVINQMVATYFGGVVDDKILDSLQAELDQKYKAVEPPKQAAAKEIAPKPETPKPVTAAPPTAAPPKTAGTPTVPVPTEDASALMDKKDWLAVAHHPQYLGIKTGQGIAHKKKLLAWFHANKDKFQPHEHASAVKNLTQAIGE